MKLYRLLALVVMSSVLAGCASPTMTSAELGNTRQTSAGLVLVDGEGMTLYTYDADQPGASNCTGLCAVFWPPAAAPEDADETGKFSVVVREDGSLQWAYAGMPLYGYVRDEEPGDVTGDGVDGVWHVVKP